MRFKIVVNKYQKYAEDFRLPNTITSTTLNGNGNRTREAIYTLDRITIDQEGDSKRLSHPVPHGTVIRDQRFGEKNATYYRVKQDIPSDEKIIALGKQIQEGEQRQAAEEMSQKVKVGLLIGLVTVFCIILVVILIRRYKMSKHS